MNVVSRSGNRTETEIKLFIESAAKTRRQLRDAGFAVTRRRVFERNVIVDQPGAALRKKGVLLRVREAAGVCTLTYKGKSVPGKHKSREELEATMHDAEEFLQILERLGYQRSFEYHKFRTELGVAGKAGALMLDETPIGTFLEIEGASAWIDRTAKLLGFSHDDYITESYGSLYLKYCREHGLKPSNMMFPPK
jgi:adenylate cyclase class 2